jgi:hypothetical protein
MLRFPNRGGVSYTVEFSNDLTHWTTQDEIYGLGHEYVVAMREFTPPPPPEPGAPPAIPSQPATNVSLRIQSASGAAGGTVVSWASLDHSGPLVVRIDGEIDAGWNQIPLFWDRYDAYRFFIWHPSGESVPPVENPPLGPNDSAVLAALETNLPSMNLQIADSVATLPNPHPRTRIQNASGGSK